MAEPDLAALVPGDLVTSLRGRDRGTVSLVWGILGRQRVAIVDGALHPLARPKAKNRRHLQAMGHATDLAHRIALGQPLSDGEIRKAIAAYVEAQRVAQSTGEGGSRSGEGR